MQQAQQASASQTGANEERKQPEEVSSVAVRFKKEKGFKLSRDEFEAMLDSVTSSLKSTQLQKGQRHMA